MPRIGSGTPDVSIVEFFDYRCHFCRDMELSLERLIREDVNLLILLEPWPIYGAMSDYAARIAIVSAWQGLFQPVHGALFKAELQDRDAVRQVAKGAGLDLPKADLDLSERRVEVDAMVALGGRTATALGLHVTPGLLIGSKLVPGALTYEDLGAVVSEVRAG